MKTQRPFLPATQDATRALGAQIQAARRELQWSQEELAGRLGVARHVVGNIERGSTSTRVGLVLEAAVLCGVPLFGEDSRGLRVFSQTEQMRAALLPARVRQSPIEISDDF